MSKKHKLALTVLRYGLDSHALITVITGDIGCGKTTLVRKLIGEARDDITIGLITNTHRAFGDPLKMALLAFDLEYAGKTNTERYETLVDFIINEYAQRRHTVLIVDEAQNLDESALEELRMLSNINVDSHHILQLVLVGQPELRDSLNRPELRQFAQRVSADYHILPLSLEEIAAYIQHRLKVVEGDPNIFLPDTYPLIHAHSSGVPRLINILCDTALVYAYGSEQKLIDVKLIKEVIEHRESGVYFRDGPSQSKKLKWGQVPTNDTQADSQVSVSDAKPVTAEGEERASMEVAFERHDESISKRRRPNIIIEPKDEKPVVKQGKKHTQEIKNKDSHTSKPGQTNAVDDKQSEAELDAILSNKPADTRPTFSTIQPPTRQIVEAPKRKSTETPEPKKRLGKKVAVSIIALILSVGGLYLYQNPTAIDAFKHRIAQSQIQSLLTKSQKFLDAGQLIEPVGANAHEVLYAVFERESNNSAAKEQLAAIRDKLFAISMKIQGVASESKRFLKTKQVETPDSENAYEAFSRILASAPGDVDARVAMDSVKDNLYSVAISVQNQGNWDQARSQLQALMQIELNSDRGQKLLARVDEAQSAEQLEIKAIARIKSWLVEANKYVKAGQLIAPQGDNAVALFKKVLGEDADNTQAMLGIEQIKDQLFGNASSAQTEGNWDQSRSQLKALLQISPQSERGQKLLTMVNDAQAAERTQVETQTRIASWLVQADEYIKANQITAPVGENAYALLKKVLQQDASNTQALARIEQIKDQLFGNASSAQTEGNWEQSRSQLKALLQISPQSERGQKLLTTLDEAQFAEQAAVEAQAKINNWLVQAQEYVKAKQLTAPVGENAYALLNKVLEQDADNTQAQAGIEQIKDQLFGNASSAQTEGNWEQSRSQLKALLQISPQSERGQKLLATLDEAQIAEQAEVEAQARIDNWLVQAQEYVKAKQLTAPVGENAYALLNKVLAQDSSNPKAQAGIEQIKDQLFGNASSAQTEGNWDQSRSQLKALLQISPQSERGQKLLTMVNDAQAAERTQVETQTRIASWLVQADEYIKANQITAPVGENAYALLNKVLEQDSSNPKALAGIEQIKDQLFSNATTAQTEGNWDQARSHLQALMQIETNSERGQKLLATLDEAQFVEQAEVEAQAKINNWLVQAQEYVKAKQLTAPVGENAYALLNKVLEQDSSNPKALAGIEQIKDQLFGNASSAQTEDNWEQARSHLQALMQIETNSERGQKLLATLDEAQFAEQAALEAQARIDNWLVQAQGYVKAKQLTAPVGENAYALLKKVLQQDASNTQALGSIEQIKDQLFGNASSAQTEGNWDQARSHLQALMQIETNSERSQKLLAILDEAQFAEQAALEAQARIDNWLVQAQGYVKAKQLIAPVGENAYALLKKVLEQDAGNTQAQASIEQIKDQLFSNVTTAQTEGNWEQARSQLQAILKILPQSQRGQTLLATIDEAQSTELGELKAQTKIQNWLAQAVEYIASNQLVTPEGENAYALFTQVLQLEATNKKALEGIGAIEGKLFVAALKAQQQGDWDLARRQLEALIRIDSQNKQSQNALLAVNRAQAAEQEQAETQAQLGSWLETAKAYFEKGKLLEPAQNNAYENFYKVLEQSPQNATALAGMQAIKDQLFEQAVAIQKQGDWEKARAQLQALIQIEPQSERGWEALERLTVAQQEQVAERAQIQNWIKKAKTYTQNGQAFEPVGANAYELFSKVLEIAPKNVDALAGVELLKSQLITDAKTAQTQGNWDAARSKLWALLQIDSHNEVATRALAELATAQQASDIAEGELQAVPTEQAEIIDPVEVAPPTNQPGIDQELLNIFQSGGAGLPLPQETE